MATPTPKGPNKEAVERMFNEIARSYDSINTLLSFGTDGRWRKKLVGLIAERGAKEILDLAAGTGEVTVGLAEALPESHITAADLSEGMLGVARHKLEQRGLGKRVDVVVADAETLPFNDEVFDCVSLVFGIRNFSAPTEAVGELFRTTKSGAVVYIMEFGTPRKGLFGWCYRLYQRHIMPFVGGVLSGKWQAYRYLPASINAFSERVDVAQLLSNAGFRDVTTTPLTGGIAKLYIAHK